MLPIKSYTFGGQRVAMRQGNEVYYLGGDHLGSTSLTTDSSGGIISEVRYYPYGQVRWSNGTSVTDFGFTSQRNEASFGLLDYNARYYSPVLGRFVSPDTIVPDPASSGGFNRYRYTRNNPLKYTDPSGHCVEGEWGECDPDLTEEMLRLRTPKDYASYAQGGLSAVQLITFGITAVAAPTVFANPSAWVGGGIGELGYIGSVGAENCLGDGCSFEGLNAGDGFAAFVTGGIAGLPGKASSVIRGAAQNGGSYVVGKFLNGETPSITLAALNAFTGGLGGKVSDKINSLLGDIAGDVATSTGGSNWQSFYFTNNQFNQCWYPKFCCERNFRYH